MRPFLGESLSVIALAVALVGMVVAALAARRGSEPLWKWARWGAYANFWVLTVSNLLMVQALVVRDFSVSYVAQVGSHDVPLFFTVISLWAALEGSLLFWAWVLAAVTALAVYIHRDAKGPMLPYALATMFGVGAFFYLLLVGPGNPFERIDPAPADGPGPNPLLQNHPLMAVHPPFQYFGYVGLMVPFAFAIGALLAGRVDATWLRLTRRWTVAAWASLTVAIIAGMWWSYEVLGWGGYWAWDPVENAALMPWLTATAFIHSAMVQERRGTLVVWNLSLAIATFLLTILGTFIVRSGILSSVHAFAEGPIGSYFLAFMAVTLVFSVVLLLGRSDRFQSTTSLKAAVSRESTILVNNLILTVVTFIVLLGTLFPLLTEAAREDTVSVGAPFFNTMTMPLIMAMVFLMGVGPALPWGRRLGDGLGRRFIVPAGATVAAAGLSVALGFRDPYAVATVGFAAFALAVNLREFAVPVRARIRARGEGVAAALGRVMVSNPRRYGGYVAHVGVVMMAVGIAASSTMKETYEETLRPGETMTAGDYELVLEDIWAQDEARRFSVGATLSAARNPNGRDLGTLEPRLNFYAMQEEPVPTPAVRSRMTDLYLTLMAFEQDGATATIQVITEPLVIWIWIGGGVITLGSLFALGFGMGRDRASGRVPPGRREPGVEANASEDAPVPGASP